MLKVLFRTFVVILLFYSWLPDALGQPTLPSDLKKPKKFENKLLGSEKSAEKKFTRSRRFIQNTVTQYNWYFNANNKLNEVVERAKASNKDDFSTLLPFYNYSLDKTALDKNELDSVVYKSNTGILIHDLRNAWIDNLFMLMGKAYYYRKDLDSARLTFQYINYAFSPKDDGYDMPIGSNANEGTNALSISTKENNSVVKRILTTPPSRNESFIWQTKTYLQKDALPEAASLIETLKNDPVFPERLQTDLNEVQALLFYKQKMYDSAAFYLERSLGNAVNRLETSRWEYLIAQLYERAHQPELAKEFYGRAINHTLDPVLDVYARLNLIRQDKDDSIAIKKNIEELLKMGRRDRYSKYRDIIYYTAAQIELERKNIPGAKAMLLKSTAASVNNLNIAQRTKSFLMLGDLSFDEKIFPDAKRFYDSVNTNDPGVTEPLALEKRKNLLQQIVTQLDIISRQDSLQKLAAMPEADRNAILKKMLRQIRKKQGLKEEETGNAAMGMNNSASAPAPDLFETPSAKGDWYFNNPSLKSQGYTSFKSTWGSRPNVDNWRRQASISQSVAAAKENKANQPGADSIGAKPEAAGEMSLEFLLKNIPLTPEQLSASNDSVGNATLDLGIAYVDGLEEYPMAMDTLENFVDKYTYSSRVPEALYYLYYCYKKTGNETKAAEALASLKQKYAGTNYEQKISNGVTGKDAKDKAAVTHDYENIYTKFIEGDFEEALRLKSITDSVYGTNYWTPQLLYIESVYYLKQRKDTEAKNVLQKIIELYPDSALATRSKAIIEALGRRKEIEEYLTKLELKPITEDTITDDRAMVVKKPFRDPSLPPEPLKQSDLTIAKNVDSLRKNQTFANQPQIVKKDTLAALKKDTPAALKKDTLKIAPLVSTYTFSPESPQLVVIVLTKVDPVYVSESKNAFDRYNKEKYYNKPIGISNESLSDTLKLVVMQGFENSGAALDYIEKTQAVASTRIVPWLPAGKYAFMLISEQNIEVLKNSHDLNAYRKFLVHYYPDKFK